MKTLLACFLLLLAAGSAFGQRGEFEVTEEVLVPEIRRFGINLGNDSWYDGSILTRERIPHGGFEGVLYRQLTYGPGGDATSAVDWFQIGEWKDVLLNAQARFVTGPRKGRIERVTDITTRVLPERPDIKSLLSYTFAKAGPVPATNDGLLFERLLDDTGYVGQHGGAWWVFASGKGTVRTVSHDTPPGSWGRISLQLAAPTTGSSVGILAPALSTRWVRPQGRWRLRFWAKGRAPFTVYLGDFAHRGEKAPYVQAVTPGPQWKRYELFFDVDDYGYELFGAGVQLAQGTLLLDEISLTRLGDGNPTVFRDEVVDALKKLRPGVLRHLQIGGSSLRNILEPRLSRLAFSASRTDPPVTNTWPGHPEERGRARTHSYGLHEFLDLCAEVGADPWYCVPGTFTKREMLSLVEYLAGPPSTPYGRVRSNRGRQAPWTESFGSIFIEIGNEAWNEIPPFLHGGYSRKGGYWNGLFAAAKASSHYSPKIVLTAGGQAVNPERNRALLREAPHCDLFALAPYLLHELSAAEAETLGTEGLIRKVLAMPQKLAESGPMVRNHQWLTRDLGTELAVYEINHHLTGGDAPADIRNALVAGVAGGINVAHWMLLLLERFQIRVQNFFTFLQYEYPFAPDAGVKLWGGAIDLEEGRQRFRPAWLALQAVNSVLSGDLVRVRQGRKQQYISVFATRDGIDFGLLLFNLDLSTPHQVRIALPVAARRVLSGTQLAGPSPTANNESGHAPEVVLQHVRIPLTGNTVEFELPPCSLTVLNTRLEAQ